MMIRFLLIFGFALSVVSVRAATTISKGPDGVWQLQRNGKPFFINGAGGSSHLETLVASGGNSLRTWGVESLEQPVDGKRFIDRAADLGIAVTAGIWVQHERHGFDYGDPKQVQAQRETVRAAVRKYKDCPALLLWGLGNEMEDPRSSGNEPGVTRIWKELNVLAGIIKEEDPGHPVMTVIAGAAPAKVKGIMANYPNIDILGINAYSSGGGAGATLKSIGWSKPFVLTEFGPAGEWEVPKTKWGAPIEASSWDKAANYYATQQRLLETSKDIFLGSYAFLWGQKQEATSTWFGMFLDSGEKLPSVDAMTRVWTGHWPANRSPKINAYQSTAREKTVKPSEDFTASIDATDAEKDPLTYEWSVVAESTDQGVGGDTEKAPPVIPNCTEGQSTAQATVHAPAKPGAYRLFVAVKDGKGGASKDNFPFQVAP